MASIIQPSQPYSGSTSSNESQPQPHIIERTPKEEEMKTNDDDEIRSDHDSCTSSCTCPKSSSFSSYPSMVLVGAFSRIGMSHIQTNEPRQDAFCVPDPRDEPRTPAWCSLFDGHGTIGEQVSGFCAAQLPKLMTKQKSQHNKETPWMPDFEQAYAWLNENVRANTKWERAGCTALSIYITDTQYLTAQTGDAVALLACHEAGQMSVQALHPTLHRLSNRSEKKRLSQHDSAQFSGPYLKFGGQKLMVTRDIGNASFGDLVIPTPDCSLLKRTEHDSFIVMATDGVWEESSSPRSMMSLMTHCLVSRYHTSQHHKIDRTFLNNVCKDFIAAMDARTTLRDDATIILILLRSVEEIVTALESGSGASSHNTDKSKPQAADAASTSVPNPAKQS